MSELRRSRADECVSDLLLDRHLAGELAGTKDGLTLEAHLATCAACSTRLGELKKDLAQFPDEVFVEGLVARAHVRTRKPRRASWIGGGLVAAAGIAAATLFWLRPEPPKERLKGSLALSLVIKDASGQIETFAPGMPLTGGDSVRFRVSTDRPGFAGVIGIDAAHVVSPYVPASGELVSIGAGREQLLEGAITLDETLGAERMIAVVCATRMDMARLIEAGRAALEAAGGDPQKVDALAVPCRQAGVLVQKVPKPK